MKVANKTCKNNSNCNDCNEIWTLPWLLEEFKYFLNALSFSEDMTNKIIYLEKGEKVVDENGEVIYESK